MLVKEKQIVAIMSIAAISFLLGTTINFVATASGGNPWDKVWTAISELQRGIRNIEESVSETSRVELVRVGSVDGAPYYYYYGVSGRWNVTKLQTEPFKDQLNSTIGGALTYLESNLGVVSPFDPEYKGYERIVIMTVNRELSPTEIEEARLLIQEYLV